MCGKIIKKTSQVIDIKGKLKTRHCPKCSQDALYFNFSNALICRNCCYMPSCPTCKRHYMMDDIFKGEHGIEYMKKPDEYKNIKGALQGLVSQLSWILDFDGRFSHSKTKEEFVYDIDCFLKDYNDSYSLGIKRYSDKIETKEDLEYTIKSKENKIKELERNADFHKRWHDERIENLKKEIDKFKKVQNKEENKNG